jgi:hypothetical protein
MESLFAVFMSVVVLVPTLIIAALITLVAVRGSRNKYVSSSSLVLESFSIKPDASGEPVIDITGRHGGIVFWILTNLGMQSRFQMTITEKEWTLREGSLAGMKVVCVPLKRIRATICGYQRSLLAFFLAVVFALEAAWTLLGIFPILFRAARAGTEGGREAAAAQLAMALVSIFLSLAACGIAGLFYYRSKRVVFGVDAGNVYGVAFKRSLVEGTVIDLDAAEFATVLLNRLVASAVYEIPLAQLPPPSVQNPPAPGPGTLRAWMIISMYAGLLVLGTLLDWYGKGVTLQISTVPTGTSVFLDNAFVGATSKETPLLLLPHTTREKHTLQFQSVGYEPLAQVIYVGGFESSQNVAVKLALPHYPVTVITTPGNSIVAVDGSHVAADGRDFGASNEAGFLTIPSVDRGEHEFSVSHDGYRTATVKIDVDRRISLHFNLVNEAEAARQEAEVRQREIASHLDRGRVLYRQGQYAEASAECDSALKLDPSNAAALALQKQIEQTRRILGK